MQTVGLALLIVLIVVGVAVLFGGRHSSSPPPAAGLPASPGTNTASTRIEHVDAAGAARLLGRPGLTILDLRTPEEYAVAHLEGARLVNYNSPRFAEELAQLDRAQPYLIHCASGRRSTAALETFRKLGFQQVIHLDGGLRAWQAAGHPVVRSAQTPH